MEVKITDACHIDRSPHPDQKIKVIFLKLIWYMMISLFQIGNENELLMCANVGMYFIT